MSSQLIADMLIELFKIREDIQALKKKVEHLDECENELDQLKWMKSKLEKQLIRAFESAVSSR